MLTTTFVSAGVLELLLPFAAGFFLWKKFGAQWKVFFVGVLAFILSQIIHLPLLLGVDWLFSQTQIEQSWSQTALLVLNSLILGSLAALCEEPLRWLSFKWMKGVGDPFRENLALGAGHGGVESLLVGVSVIGSAISLILWQQGTLPIPGDQLVFFEGLAATDWYPPLLGVFDRMSTMVLHISLSSLVWVAYRFKKPAFFTIALGWHFLIDALIVFLSGLGWSPLALEGVIAVAMLISAVIIYRIYKTYGKDELYAPSKLPSEPPLQEAS